MADSANPTQPPPTTCTAAATPVQQPIGTLQAIPRLLDPRPPFQLILLGSVDLVAWP